MVIGSRMLGVREKGALLPQALFGNKLAAFFNPVILEVQVYRPGPRSGQSDIKHCLP